jgi:Predicted amidophosphoribosyltransferases
MLLDLLLSTLAPHICMGCSQVGSGLCESCKNDIIDEVYSDCLMCNKTTKHNCICLVCQKSSSISRAFVVGKNKGVLKRFIYDYKFTPIRSYGKDLTDILDKMLPILPKDTVVVPIPTVSKHIRQRGFGHIELIAKLLSRKRRLKYSELLIRNDNSVQHGLKANQRAKAAAKTFSINSRAKIPNEILLIDDIYTTGSTIRFASKLLKEAGVKTINLAIIARHTK